MQCPTFRRLLLLAEKRQARPNEHGREKKPTVSKSKTASSRKKAG